MSIIALVFNKCASGSVGRARPCQGRGRGFEPRLALFLFTRRQSEDMSVLAQDYPSAPANPSSLAKRDARGL